MEDLLEIILANQRTDRFKHRRGWHVIPKRLLHGERSLSRDEHSKEPPYGCLAHACDPSAEFGQIGGDLNRSTQHRRHTAPRGFELQGLAGPLVEVVRRLV